MPRLRAGHSYIRKSVENGDYHLGKNWQGCSQQMGTSVMYLERAAADDRGGRGGGAADLVEVTPAERHALSRRAFLPTDQEKVIAVHSAEEIAFRRNV
jgi:hypothetical protein